MMRSRSVGGPKMPIDVSAELTTCAAKKDIVLQEGHKITTTHNA